MNSSSFNNINGSGNGTGNDNDNDSLPDPFEGSSSLDHALLESLFYNEMVALGDDFSESSLLGGLAPPASETGDAVAQVAVDVEKEILSGFDSPAAAVAGPPPPKPPVIMSTTAAAASAVVPPVFFQGQQRPRGIRHNVAPLSAAVSEEEKRKKLVTQFATLAGRLGIDLPPQVLQKLTANAAAASTSNQNIQQQASLSSKPASSLSVTKTDAVVSANAPIEQQLQSTATEAIAAVTQKRSAEDSTSNNNATSAKYSKRRKKPRLSDCERKLAELQSENALLKRHLDNISNAKRVTDSERIAAEQRMKQMLESNAPDEELAPVIQSFTELYSDYGRKRHEELNFHLEQLQRLANPTNFTKMGLWTLGGQSRNKSGNDPIAGILQRELDITQQQGRKIIEQRQEIQDVCSNLKEVRFQSSCGCVCSEIT